MPSTIQTSPCCGAALETDADGSRCVCSRCGAPFRIEMKLAPQDRDAVVAVDSTQSTEPTAHKGVRRKVRVRRKPESESESRSKSRPKILLLVGSILLFGLLVEIALTAWHWYRASATEQKYLIDAD